MKTAVLLIVGGVGGALLTWVLVWYWLFKNTNW
jgi:hypothetical protein